MIDISKIGIECGNMREKLGYSIAKASRKSRCSRSSLSNFERGITKHSLTLLKLAAIADMLGVSILDLIKIGLK
jgi:transcriptional regulator with XRE-family HTH domain